MRGSQKSSEALVAACLERIADRDEHLKAWVHVAGDSALATARALDREPPRSLLHGVPVGIKDVIDTADMPTTFNSPIYAGHRPKADAAAVALLRRAGCVILGKTATAEFAFSSPPSTRNPHNPAHTPGGSSSGSAAAVADRMAPLALGTQTGGSVIRPAAFCGVVGFKPSFGTVNRTGVKPVADSLDTVGWFSRTVEDAATALHVLSGLALADATGPFAPRIGFARTSRWAKADDASHASLESAARRFAAAGAVVAEIALPPAVDALFTGQQQLMKFEAARALAWEQDRHGKALSEALRSRLAEGWAISRDEYDRARALALEARAQHADLMRSFDFLLAPSAPGEAPLGLASTGDSVFNGLWTALGVPCINLPFGRGPAGLPLGLQLVGAFGDDVALLGRAGRAASVLG